MFVVEFVNHSFLLGFKYSSFESPLCFEQLHRETLFLIYNYVEVQFKVALRKAVKYTFLLLSG